MKRLSALIVGFAVTAGVLVAPATSASAASDVPPNAIVSEGNGAAVFIGYGGDQKIQLSWRPAKKYEKSTMLYQVQRSDGAMLVSNSFSTQFTDPGLKPNTNYSYTLRTYLATTRNWTSNGKQMTKTTTKRVGTNKITVMTLPSMVVGLRASNVLGTSFTLTWLPPQYMENPVTYSVYVNGNLMAYELADLTYDVLDVADNGSYTVKVVPHNAAGDSVTNAQIMVRTPPLPKS